MEPRVLEQDAAQGEVNDVAGMVLLVRDGTLVSLVSLVSVLVSVLAAVLVSMLVASLLVTMFLMPVLLVSVFLTAMTVRLHTGNAVSMVSMLVPVSMNSHCVLMTMPIQRPSI